MLSNQEISTVVKECIDNLGLAYRMQLTYVRFSTGEEREDNYIDIKIYDSVNRETGSIRLDNVSPEHIEDNDVNPAREGIKVYDLNSIDDEEEEKEDGEKVISDITKINSESLTLVITDVVRAMAGSTIFSVN